MCLGGYEASMIHYDSKMKTNLVSKYAYSWFTNETGRETTIVRENSWRSNYDIQVFACERVKVDSMGYVAFLSYHYNIAHTLHTQLTCGRAYMYHTLKHTHTHTHAPYKLGTITSTPSWGITKWTTGFWAILHFPQGCYLFEWCCLYCLFFFFFTCPLGLWMPNNPSIMWFPWIWWHCQNTE